MRVLEAYVLKKQPSSPIFSGPHKRGKDAYDRAYAVVDIGVPGWQILHANAAFNQVSGISQAGCVNIILAMRKPYISGSHKQQRVLEQLKGISALMTQQGLGT